MSLPKQNRRTIVVDGVSYHWTRGRAPCNGWVTVQSVSGHGALLRIDLWGVPTPVDVAEGIRFAVTNGWDSTKAGREVSLGFYGNAQTERFGLLANYSPDFWTACRLRDAEQKVIDGHIRQPCDAE